MNKRPKDLEHAAKKFAQFHKRDPETFQELRLTRLPKELPHVGDASFMSYRSDKWDEGTHDYWHDHEANVKTCIPGKKGPFIKVPSALQRTDVLVRLGDCLGFGYTDHDGELIEARVRKPYPELFCTPDGRSLVVIQGRRELVAVIWGGYLDVREAGIVS